MTKSEHTGRKLALGALIAGVAGYVTGILTAPKSGKETRKDISDKAGQAKQETEQALQSAHDEVTDLIQQTKNRAAGLKAQTRAELNEAVIRAKDAQKKAATLLKAVRAGSAEDPELDRALKQLKQAKKNLGKYLKS